MGERSRLLVVAAGGTGGHMFPAQALAEVMLRRGWRVRLSTDPRGARFAGGFPHSVEISQASSASFARGAAAARLAVPLRLAAGIGGAVRGMLRERPDAVIGFGGYPSVPALAAATLLRVPRALHEQNAALGRVNQAFAKRVHAVACGAWPTDLPKGACGHHVGNPLRMAVLKRAGAEYIAPGEYPMTALVMGGSQGARALSEAAPAAVAALPDGLRGRLRIFHQAREEDVEAAARTYAQCGVDARVEPFFRDVERILSEAQLVVSRSGASSVAEICAIGRPSILVPFAAALRDEQTRNARGLVEAGGAVLIRERDLSPEALAGEIRRILEDPGAAKAMADAALGLARPDAHERLADLVERVADGAGEAR